MQDSNWAFIAIELVLVFGGALAFAWWQLRDVAKAQKETLEKKNRAQGKHL